MFWFKLRIWDMGLDPADYSVHSFRHGCITKAFKVVGSIALIKIASNHLSEAVFTYSTVPMHRRRTMTEKILTSLRTQ